MKHMRQYANIIEGLNLANQNNWKSGVFGQKLVKAIPYSTVAVFFIDTRENKTKKFK